MKNLINFAKSAVLSIGETIDKYAEKFFGFILPNKHPRFYANVQKLDAYVEKKMFKSRVKVNRAHKYLNGKIRLTRLVETLIDDFIKEHNELLWIIEHQEYRKGDVKYDECKRRIQVIIRAKNRLKKKRITNKESCQRILLNRDFKMRFHTHKFA